VRRQAIEQELAVNIVRLANASAQERVKIAERLAGLLTDATRKQIETEAALRRQEVTEAGRDGRIGGGIRRRGLSEEEIRRRTRGFEGIQDQIRSVLVATEADTESQLQSIERAYRSFADRIVGILKPVTDMIKLITDPQTALNALIPRNLVPAPAAVPTPAAAPTVNYFTFQGTTFRLTADETAIIRRVLEAIMGSEGARYFDDHMKRRPGGR